MNDEQVEQICLAIRAALRFQNADVFEHVFGGYKDEESLVSGICGIARALDRIADAVDDRGDALITMGESLDRIATVLEGQSGVKGTT